MQFVDSGAITDVISLSLCERLHVKPRKTIRRIPMADGKEAMVVGQVHGLLITVGPIATEVSFLEVLD